MARSSEREQFLADIITTAIEGGTGYWAGVLVYRWVDLPPSEVYASIIEEDDSDRRGPQRIDIDVIDKGIDLVKAEIHLARDDIRQSILLGDKENDAGQIDADGADVIVQAALFGEVMYG